MGQKELQIQFDRIEIGFRIYNQYQIVLPPKEAGNIALGVNPGP